MDTLFAFFDWVASNWEPMPTWLKVVVLYLVLCVVGVVWLIWVARRAPLMDDNGRIVRNPTPAAQPNGEPGERRR